MVLRERKINNKSDVVQIHLSYGLPDIKTMLKYYAKLLSGDFGTMTKWAKSLLITEDELRYYFEHSPQSFANFPDKWRQQLSAWAFSVAVRNKLLIESATKENCYILADCLFVKRGRPRNDGD